MSFTRRPNEGHSILSIAALAAFVAIATLPSVSIAQGGGGMGGGFGPPGGGGMGGHGHRGMNNSSNESAPNVSKHFEDLASLKDALKHVDGLTKDQKDAFPEIERGYLKLFKPLGQEAQQIIDSAHAAHDRPDRQRMDSLRQAGKDLRERELAAARNILSTDPQRDQFDKNVAEIHDEEAKREEQMEQRAGGHS